MKLQSNRTIVCLYLNKQKKSDRYSIAWKQPLRLSVLQYSEIEYAVGNVQIDIGNVGSSS